MTDSPPPAKTIGTARKDGLARTLMLVRELAATNDGLTIEDMMAHLGQGRRSAERTRKLIGGEFELDYTTDGEGRKRWRIPDGVTASFANLTAEELAALSTAMAAAKKRREGTAGPLASLLAKLKSVGDDRRRTTLEADLTYLARLQSTIAGPGPMTLVEPETYPTIAQALIAGYCIEFDYRAAGSEDSKWRRIVPYGLVQGQVSYFIGRFPDYEQLIVFRLDRMSNVRQSDLFMAAPEEFDLDDWLSHSFGIWREEPFEVSLRILPHAAAKARGWRFHGSQVIADELDKDGTPTGALLVTFKAGGLTEMAEHLLTWAGDAVVLGPEALKDEIRAKVKAAKGLVRG